MNRHGVLDRFYRVRQTRLAMSSTTPVMSEHFELTIWRLKAGLEKKFSKGHPWVFSSDLDQSPKGVTAGAFIELRNSADQFLAFGYGNPATLIAFRTLARIPIGRDARQLTAFLAGVLEQAARLRNSVGIDRLSHRLIFGEADGLPGVVIDRYVGNSVDGSRGQVFVIQSSTAGADHLLPYLISSILNFASQELAFGGEGRSLPTAIVVTQDSSARGIEGLKKEPRRVVQGWPGFEAGTFRIEVQSVAGLAPYWVNFIEGQKTGFFLDQRLNVRLAWPLFAHALAVAKQQGRKAKVLDLFCYVGQWAVQVSLAAKVQNGAPNIAPNVAPNCVVEVDLADASAAALALASRNVEEVGGVPVVRKMDVVQDIGKLAVGQYDIVICDPPAFAKKKKDLPIGLAAYQKLNREAIRRVRPGGVFVTCSCSGLVTDEDFEMMLAQAVRASGRDVRWVAHGGHGEDHPMISAFPQGRYLKGWIGVVL